MSQYIDFQTEVSELAATDPSSNCYFLLDQGGMPGLHRQLSRSSVEWLSLFEYTREESALAAAPILVLAAAEGRVCMPRYLSEWIGKNGTYTSAVNMLSSPLQIGPMRTYMTARLQVKLTENMEAMLRFFDPRILESLANILSLEQAKKFFGLTKVWRFVDRNGKWKDISTNFNPQGEFSSSLSLDAQQEFSLITASEADQVLAFLQGNVPSLLGKLDSHGQYSFISEKVNDARRHGLETVLQFSIYTSAMLIDGNELMKGPLWGEFLDKLRQNDFCFSEDSLMEGLKKGAGDENRVENPS